MESIYINTDVLTFQQFLLLQSRFSGGPSGARPMDNIPMGERGSNPQTVYQTALKGQIGSRERMQFADQDGTNWDVQWAYAVPPKTTTY